MPANKIQDLFSVSSLVAVITGGGSGLGLYAARALDANGAKAVYIVGRREETLKKAAASGVNGRIIPIVGDVTDKASLEKVVQQVKEEVGYVNVLFANAGISGPPSRKKVDEVDAQKGGIKELQAALWEPDMQTFTDPMHVNATGVYFASVAFLELLVEGNKKGNVPQDSQILVTSSIAGFSRHLASGFAYSASKAATNHLVKMLSTFFASREGLRVRVNLIAPGLYPSEMTAGSVGKLEKVVSEGRSEGHWEDAYQMAKRECPGLRTGSEEDFAATVLFMVSKAGAYLNGETLVSDGGRLAQMPATY